MLQLGKHSYGIKKLLMLIVEERWCVLVPLLMVDHIVHQILLHSLNYIPYFHLTSIVCCNHPIYQHLSWCPVPLSSHRMQYPSLRKRFQLMLNDGKKNTVQNKKVINIVWIQKLMTLMLGKDRLMLGKDRLMLGKG